jgi:hypothetical protein
VSDFFTNLAASIYEPRRSVQPRLPFIFESTPESLALPPEISVEAEVPPTHPRGGESALGDVAAGASAPHNFDRPVPSRKRNGANVQIPPEPARDLESPANEPGSTPPVQRRQAAAVARREERPEAAEASHVGSAIAAPLLEKSAVAAARISAAAVAAPEPRVPHVYKEGPSRPAAQAVAPLPVVARGRPPAPSAVARARAMPEISRRPRIAPAAETTVQVSIGRIEVRAVAAPAPRSRPAKKPAVMALDEYLRSRAEQRR